MTAHKFRSTASEKLEKRTVQIALVMVMAVLTGVAAQSEIFEAGGSSELVAEYRFDTGAGDTVYDSSNNSNNGNIIGANWTSGRRGKALEFDGNDDTVRVPYDSSMQQDELTASAWVYFTDDKTWNTISARYDYGTGQRVWSHYITENDYYVHLSSDGSGTAKEYRTNFQLAQDEWHHVAYSFKDNNLEMYVNGEQLDDSQITKVEDDTVNSLYDTNVDISIGDLLQNDAPSGGNKYRGKLDDVLVYKKALNSSQVKSLYNQGGFSTGEEENETSGKLLDIDFDRKNSSKLFDASGNKYHGTPKGGAESRESAYCRQGECYDMNGDGYVSTDFDMNLGYQDFTAMLWFKTPADKDTQEKLVGSDRNGNDGFLLAHNYDSRLKWSLDGAGEFVNVLEKDVWQHVTYVRRNNRSIVYVNGKIESNTSNVKNIDNPESLNIGANGYENKKYNGKIDEVKLFDRALSRREVVQEAGIERSGAVLDMRFDRGAGSKVYDSSRYGNDGVLKPNESGGPERVSGVQGKALKFDGSDDWASIQNFGNDFSSDDTLTVSAWVKGKSYDSPNNLYNPIMNHGAQGNYFYFGLSETGFPFVRTSSVATAATAEENGVDVDDNTWHHVVGRFNQEKQEVTVFVDGKESYRTEFSDTLSVSDQDIEIAKYDASGGTRYFRMGGNAQIDNLKYFQHGLSNEQIKQLYSRGSSRIGGNTDGSTVPQSPGKEDLVGYWSMDEGNSSYTFDESGNVNHGQIDWQPKIIESSKCIIGDCIRFNGSGVVDAGTDSSWTSPPLSGFFWTDAGGDSGEKFGYMSSLGAVGGWSIYSEWGSLDFKYKNSTDYIGLTKEGFPDNGWQHIGFTHGGNGIGGYNTTFYVNGKKFYEISKPRSFAGHGSTLKIGRGGGGNGGSLTGKVDEVKIYNATLNASSVWKIYAEGRERLGIGEMPGPSAWWRMDNKTGQAVIDYSGEGNDGNRGNYLSSESKDPQRVDDCKIGKCLNFDGQDDYVNGPLNPSIDLGDETHSFTTWVRFDETFDSSAVNESTLLRYPGDGQVTRFETDGTLKFSLEMVDDNYYTVSSTRSSWNAGEWYHVAGVYNSTHQMIFVDGDRQDIQKVTLSLKEAQNGPHISDDANGNNLGPLNGTVDDFRIYPYGLTQNQVRQIMNYGAAQVG